MVSQATANLAGASVRIEIESLTMRDRLWRHTRAADRHVTDRDAASGVAPVAAALLIGPKTAVLEIPR
jgi:hypothetical protein